MKLTAYDLNADWFLFEGEGENITCTLDEMDGSKRFAPAQRAEMLKLVAAKGIDLKALRAPKKADDAAPI